MAQTRCEQTDRVIPIYASKLKLCVGVCVEGMGFWGCYEYSKIAAMFHLEIYLHFHPEVTSTVIGKNFFQWAIFKFFYELIVILSMGNFFIVYTDFDGPFSKLL